MSSGSRFTRRRRRVWPRVRRRWYWLMGRTVWRLYPPGVTRGPIYWLWFRWRKGWPCSDQIPWEMHRDRKRYGDG